MPLISEGDDGQRWWEEEPQLLLRASPILYALPGILVPLIFGAVGAGTKHRTDIIAAHCSPEPLQEESRAALARAVEDNDPLRVGETVKSALRLLFQLMYMSALVFLLSAVFGQSTVVNLLHSFDDAFVDSLLTRACPSTFRFTLTADGPFRINQDLPYRFTATMARDMLPPTVHSLLALQTTAAEGQFGSPEVALHEALKALKEAAGHEADDTDFPGALGRGGASGKDRAAVRRQNQQQQQQQQHDDGPGSDFCLIGFYRSERQRQQHESSGPFFPSTCVLSVVLNARQVYVEGWEDVVVDVPSLSTYLDVNDEDGMPGRGAVDVPLDCRLLEGLADEYLRPITSRPSVRLTVAGGILGVTAALSALHTLLMLLLVAVAGRALASHLVEVPHIAILDWMQLCLYSGLFVPALMDAKWLYAQMLCFWICTHLPAGKISRRASFLLRPLLLFAAIALRSTQSPFTNPSIATFFLCSGGSVLIVVLSLRTRVREQRAQLQMLRFGNVNNGE